MLFGIAPTSEGEWGFGDVLWERTSFANRDHAKEFVGTHAALWGIAAGVYLASMGPQGMKELGEISSYYAGKDIPLLIPGVGSQGGSATDVMAALKAAGYELQLARINSSSGLTHPWKKGAAPEGWLDDVMGAIHALFTEASI